MLGGCGHIGLPLCLTLADFGYKVIALDTNSKICEKVNSGIVPFLEEGADDLLKKVIDKRNFYASSDYEFIRRADVIIICVGTPVDEHLSPIPRLFLDLIATIEPFLNKKQIVILRSTVFPGTTEIVAKRLNNKSVKVAYCPERIIQGKALIELHTLPQIISAFDSESLNRTKNIFENFGGTITSSVQEAEFAKLFLNAFRYITFAITNQFYMIANNAGVEYSNILRVMKHNYERGSLIPSPGFTGGPCLIKDTLQLVAHSQNNFTLGSNAFFVNEGLALYVVNEIKERYENKDLVIGILGMAFKANNDDIRSSLSYRVKKSLQLYGYEVLTTDPYTKNDANLIDADDLVSGSDVLVICTPHEKYKHLDFKGKSVIDIWNLLGNGSGINLVNSND